MTIPDTIVSDLISSVGNVFDACQPLILLIFGIGITFYIAKGIQALLPTK